MHMAGFGGHTHLLPAGHVSSYSTLPGPSATHHSRPCGTVTLLLGSPAWLCPLRGCAGQWGTVATVTVALSSIFERRVSDFGFIRRDYRLCILTLRVSNDPNFKSRDTVTQGKQCGNLSDIIPSYNCPCCLWRE